MKGLSGTGTKEDPVVMPWEYVNDWRFGTVIFFLRRPRWYYRSLERNPDIEFFWGPPPYIKIYNPDIDDFVLYRLRAYSWDRKRALGTMSYTEVSEV